jgi:U2 small nuclear ribonucleoprotein A'
MSQNVSLYRLPHLRLLDFKKIKDKERQDSITFFKSKKGKEVQREIQKKARLSLANDGSNAPKPPKIQASSAEIQKIRDMISNATSLHEVERLTKMLQSGNISEVFIQDEDEPMN